ncbi:MAG: hypothetical protein ACLTZT_15365 [Butyricimonas faecalis]
MLPRRVSADGHEYIRKAVAAGAVTVVCEVVPEELKEGVVYVKTAILRRHCIRL